MFNKPGTGIAAVLRALENGRPVAVTVPVYADLRFPGNADNWNTAVGVNYGRVLDPPAVSKVVSGHAICITGFEPDPTERKGGFFVFRNSWGTAWGSSAPAGAGYYSPSPGYGEISASYIDDFIWELLEF